MQAQRNRAKLREIHLHLKIPISSITQPELVIIGSVHSNVVLRIFT